MALSYVAIDWNFVVALMAAIMSLAAFWVAWRDSRRNSRVIVKLKEFTAHSTDAGNGMTHELEVRLVNCGIEMQNISASLGFIGPGGDGYFNTPLHVADMSEEASGSFLRGAVAQFEMSDRGRESQLLGSLRDLKFQKPTLRVFSNSFEVCSFPLWGRWDKWKQRWNRVSFHFMIKRKMGPGHDGKGVFKFYQLPYFEVRSWKLQNFLDCLK